MKNPPTGTARNLKFIKVFVDFQKDVITGVGNIVSITKRDNYISIEIVLGGKIQVFSRYTILLNNIKVDIVQDVIIFLQ